MNQEDVDAVREKLSSFVSYEEGRLLREALKDYGSSYIQLHTPEEYLSFMNEHECTFNVHHNQSINFPYYWGLFTVLSQRVSGDSIEECLDIAMENL